MGEEGKTTAAPVAEVATASEPHDVLHPRGRPEDGAAVARTEELYARYHRTVSGLCRALLRDPTEAEDAAQQTFLSAHRALRNGSQPEEPAAWLATIARNECWTRIRTRMREPLPAAQIEAVAARDDPVAEAIRRADLAALWSAIEALPRQQRDALLLREFGGLSYEELAAALGVSGSAVESLLFRARRRLKTQLRAVYASLSGAAWIDGLARLLAGGGAPAAAAKVAALGVGAAAVGSSAVVVPHVLENHPRGPRAVHTTVRTRHVDARPSAPAHRVVIDRQAAAPVVPAPARTATRHVRHVPTSSSHEDRGRHRGGGQAHDEGDDRGPAPATSPALPVPQETSGRGDSGRRHDDGGGTGSRGDGSSRRPGEDGADVATVAEAPTVTLPETEQSGSSDGHGGDDGKGGDSSGKSGDSGGSHDSGSRHGEDP
jgi:RNA polymerase sigma-70 factor (ECF subfamily)